LLFSRVIVPSRDVFINCMYTHTTVFAFWATLFATHTHAPCSRYASDYSYHIHAPRHTQRMEEKTTNNHVLEFAT
jgi:hypothetical protein